MIITDFTKDHKYTKTVYKFSLMINEKEVEGTYSVEDDDWSSSDEMIIENIDNITDDEQDAILDHLQNKYC